MSTKKWNNPELTQLGLDKTEESAWICNACGAIHKRKPKKECPKCGANEGFWLKVINGTNDRPSILPELGDGGIVNQS